MTRAAAIALALCAALLPATVAHARPAPARKVAILEFRSGSAALPGIARKVAALLREQTSLDIVGPRDARRTYGANLDADVVACAGEAPCIATVGRAVGADEVILIGVSELGSVIITLQRIRSEDGKVLARVAEALPAAATATPKRLGAFMRRLLPRADFSRYGTIRIDANITGAAVLIDEHRRGQTPLPPIRVPAPASYRIAVKKSGFLDFDAEVAVPPEGEVIVRPMLARAPKDAWYESWWVATIAASVLVGGGVATYLYFRDDPDDVPVVIQPF